jgi:hypothetical protein
LDKFNGVTHHIPSQYRNESVENFIVGATARSVATTVLNPITVIKTRFELAQLSEFERQNFKDGGIIRTLINIYKTEGLKKGLFSGLTPTLARDVPYAGLSFVFYSKTKSLLTTLFISGDKNGELIAQEKSITSTNTPFYITLSAGAVGGKLL